MAGKKIGENVLKLLADMGLNTLAPKLEALTRLLGRGRWALRGRSSGSRVLRRCHGGSVCPRGVLSPFPQPARMTSLAHPPPWRDAC